MADPNATSEAKLCLLPMCDAITTHGPRSGHARAHPDHRSCLKVMWLAMLSRREKKDSDMSHSSRAVSMVSHGRSQDR